MIRSLIMALLAGSLPCCPFQFCDVSLRAAQPMKVAADDSTVPAAPEPASDRFRFLVLASAVELPETLIVMVEKCPAKTRQARLAIFSTSKLRTHVYELSLAYDGEAIVAPDEFCSLKAMIEIEPNELVIFPVRFTREVYTDPDTHRRAKNVDVFRGGAQLPEVTITRFKALMK